MAGLGAATLVSVASLAPAVIGMAISVIGAWRARRSNSSVTVKVERDGKIFYLSSDDPDEAAEIVKRFLSDHLIEPGDSENRSGVDR